MSSEDKAIIETLTSQLNEAQLAKDQADAIAAEKSDRVGRLEAALRGFTGKPPKKGQRTRLGGSADKTFAKKHDVLTACAAIAKQNPAMPQDDLEALTKDKLKDEQGFCLSGVPRLLKEILRSDVFIVDEYGRVSLAAETPQVPRRSTA